MKNTLFLFVSLFVLPIFAQEEIISMGTQFASSGPITNAIVNLGGSGTIFVKGEIDIADNYTIPDGIELVFFKNGFFDIDAGKTVTINGTLKSDKNLIFNGGTVVSNPKITTAYPEWFGAKVGDAIDDSESIQKAIDFSQRTVEFVSGEYYLLFSVTVENKILNLNKATLHFDYPPTVQRECLVVKNNAIVKDGTVEYSGGGELGAGNFECPVIVGDYASGDGYSNIILEFLTIKTDSPNGNGIFITGDSDQITIRNIKFPDSNQMGRAILVHWGGADSISTSNPETTHPHNITIDNIKIGIMSLITNDADDAGIFLSGAYNVTVTNVQAKELYWKNGLLAVYAGDYGNDYTTNVNAKNLVNQGILFKNCHVELAHARVFKVDGQQEQPLPDPSIPCHNNGKKFFSGPTLVNIMGKASQNNNTHAGIVEESFGTVIKNAKFEGFGYGFVTGQNVQNLVIDGGEFFKSKNAGISINSGCHPPINTVIKGALVYQNGTNAGNHAGILLGNSSIATRLIDNTLGRTPETQKWGVRIDNQSKDNILERNHINDAVVSGFSIGSWNSYGALYRFKGNTSATSYASIALDSNGNPNPSLFQSGMTPLVIDTRMVDGSSFNLATGGIPLIRDLLGREVPGAGIWNKGDRIYNNITTSTIQGWICVKSGNSDDTNIFNDPVWEPF
jgi:hypothetical protein